jgi:hypothetical protein
MSRETSFSKHESKDVNARSADESRAISQQKRETEWESVASDHGPDRVQTINTEVSDKERRTELQLDAIYAKASAAKDEVDSLAESIAKDTHGKVAKAPLKDRARAIQKANEDYEGDASKIKDIARNTIVVDQNQYGNAVALLEKHGATVTTIDPETDPLGYSGSNAVFVTEVCIPAEIQVNTPEMTYAKESPDNAKAILGEEKYAEIAEKTGISGGRGHQLYEEWRKLPDGDPRKVKLEHESRSYYDQIRNTGKQ